MQDSRVLWIAGVPATPHWIPDRSALRTYNRLHAHKEDDRYCDTLPCGVVAANATPVCASFLECVAGGGGVYRYEGAQTGAFVGHYR